MQFINSEIQSEAEKIIQLKANDKSILDILAEIYTDRLTDKTPDQGRIIGNAIIEEIARFDADYEAARENQDSFVITTLSSMDTGKTCAERCTFWLRIAKVLQSASSVNQESDRKKILDGIQSLYISESEATPEMENELMTKVAETIKNSSVMLSAFVKHSEELNSLQESDDAAALLLDIGANEVEYRAVLSMLAYTAVKNGEIPDVPSDMTAEQVTSIVCAEVEQLRIAEEVHSGNLAVDIASVLLFSLGRVVLVHIVTAFTVFMSAMVWEAFGVILAVPGILMVAFEAVWMFGAAMRAWEEDSRTISSFAFSGVSFIISGLKTVGSFILGSIIAPLRTMNEEEDNPVPESLAVSLL